VALPYAAIAVVVNHAAGRGDSSDEVSMEGVARVLETAMDRVRALIEHVVPRVPLAPRDTALPRRAAVIIGASADDS